MAKDNKKFYDSYDELFEKQNTKKNVQKKIFSDKKQNQIKVRTLKTKTNDKLRRRKKRKMILQLCM